MCPITLTINSQRLGRSNEQTRWEFAINLLKRRPRPPPCCRGWRPLPSCDDPQWKETWHQVLQWDWDYVSPTYLNLWLFPGPMNGADTSAIVKQSTCTKLSTTWSCLRGSHLGQSWVSSQHDHSMVDWYIGLTCWLAVGLPVGYETLVTIIATEISF